MMLSEAITLKEIIVIGRRKLEVPASIRSTMVTSCGGSVMGGMWSTVRNGLEIIRNGAWESSRGIAVSARVIVLLVGIWISVLNMILLRILIVMRVLVVLGYHILIVLRHSVLVVMRVLIVLRDSILVILRHSVLIILRYMILVSGLLSGILVSGTEVVMGGLLDVSLVVLFEMEGFENSIHDFLK